jgi:phage terminase large subunit
MLPKIDHTLITNWKNPEFHPVLIHRAETIEYITANKNRFNAAWDFYKNHPVEFINDFMWTCDPRAKTPNPKKFPFVLFGRQVEYVYWLWDCYKNNKSGMVWKCRTMGASWINCAFAVWLFIFEPDSKVIMASRKESYVDKIGNLDSLLEKVRFLLRHLPKIWLPKGFNLDRDMHFKNIINSSNGAAITGESGDELARGGRGSLIIVDEAAFIPHPEIMEAAISEASNCIIYVSTPRAKADWFDTKWRSGVLENFRWRWHEDPRKDRLWYDEKKRTLSPLVFATEVEGDLSISYENVVLNYLHIQVCMELEIPPLGKIIAGLDVADEGRDKHALYVRQGHKDIYFEEWAEGDTSQAAQKAWMICEALKVECINYDAIGVGAGAKAEFTKLKKKAEEDGLKYNPEIKPIHIGSRDLIGFYSEDKKNKDMFFNLKAKVWWDIRIKSEITYKWVETIKYNYPSIKITPEFLDKNKIVVPDNVISLPDDPDLLEQMAQQQYEMKDTGLIIMKSKQEVYKRSPNKADAVILSYAHSGYTQRDFIII